MARKPRIGQTRAYWTIRIEKTPIGSEISENSSEPISIPSKKERPGSVRGKEKMRGKGGEPFCGPAD
jgi:hypothetical protein